MEPPQWAEEGFKDMRDTAELKNMIHFLDEEEEDDKSICDEHEFQFVDKDGETENVCEDKNEANTTNPLEEAVYLLDGNVPRSVRVFLSSASIANNHKFSNFDDLHNHNIVALGKRIKKILF